VEQDLAAAGIAAILHAPEARVWHVGYASERYPSTAAALDGIRIATGRGWQVAEIGYPERGGRVTVVYRILDSS
jgi:hypothetical protein